MALNPAIAQSVEKLGYRVTVGDIAAQAGLDVNLAQQGLLALASDAGGHLQVAESGEIIYLFPRDFRAILRNKSWRLRLKTWWADVWKWLFYLIRISFGIVLLLSILIMVAAIAIILIALSSSRGEEDRSSGYSDSSYGGGGFFFYPSFWIGPDLFWFFDPNYEERRRQRRHHSGASETEKRISFLEAVFSFLFGDGNPNSNLEERRWQEIGAVIRNHGGAVVAEQLAPYLDNLEASNQEDEDYMLPVLVRFNGYPQVSPEGAIVYYFPQLQIAASQRHYQPVPPYLQEQLWRFSQAGSGQIMLAIGLGSVNLILALVLGSLLQDGTVEAALGGLVAFVASIYGILLGYAIAFLVIPLLRYFWLQGRNRSIEVRNQRRQERTLALNEADPQLQHKLAYARQFAAEKVIGEDDLAYTTQEDLVDQELKQSDKIDEQWRRRLESGS